MWDNQHLSSNEILLQVPEERYFAVKHVVKHALEEVNIDTDVVT